MRTVDIENWQRKNSHDFFKSYQQPTFSVCANVTITDIYNVLESGKLSKFTAMLWLISLAANEVTEFRYRIRGESVVEHQWVHPSFAWLNDDKTITFCRADYTSDVSRFFKTVKDNLREVESNPLVADGKMNDDVLYVSCLPWLDFTSLTHPIQTDDTASIPRIAWGKFTRRDSQWQMPVSVQLHHGLADGYHASRFFQILQEQLDAAGSIAWPL